MVWRSTLQKLLTKSVWIKAMRGTLMRKGVIAPPMIPAPQCLAQGVHTTHAIIPQGATQAVSAWWTSAHPRMKVALCPEAKNMPPT